MLTFAQRNIRLYFRDRTTVFFSLLSVIITLGIYILFLGENMASSFGEFENASLLVNTWLIAGICTIAPVTTCLSSLGILVDDRANKTGKDFLASPIQRYKLIGGYLIGGITSSFITSLFTFLLGGAWLLSQGLALPPFTHIAAIIGILLLSTFSAGCMTFFILSFFHTTSAFGAAATIVGSLIGFLAGIYLPISSFPPVVQSIIKFFPPAHAAVLLRYYFLQDLATTFFEGFPGAVQEEIWLAIGVRFEVGSSLFPLWGSVLFLAGSGVLFFLLSLYPYAKKTR